MPVIVGNTVAYEPALALTAEFALHASLRRAIEAESYDAAEVARLLRRAETDNVALDMAALSRSADGRMKRAMMALETAAPAQKLSVMAEALAVAESLRTLPSPSNLWQAQNIWDEMRRRPGSRLWTFEWREGFRKLGTALGIALDEVSALEDVGALAGQ